MVFMTVLAYVIGILFIVGGLGSCAMSKTAVHEIGGLVSLLIGFGMIGAAMVVQRLTAILTELRAVRDPAVRNVG